MANKFDQSKAQATWRNVHLGVGIVAGAIKPMTVDEQRLKAIINRSFDSFEIDDDEVDAGDYDFTGMSALILTSTADDPAKTNELENIIIPITCSDGEVALDTLKIGDSAAGAGVSWGNTAAQTQIDIIANDHNITHEFAVGNLEIYGTASAINWIRAVDLVAGAIPLATEVGDATHIVIAVLPAGVIDEDGNVNRATRIFMGIPEITNLGLDGLLLVNQTVEYVLHLTQRTDAANNARILNSVARAGTQRVYPLLADAPLVTGAAAWTYGAMITIIPAVTVLVPFMVVSLNVEAISDNTEIYVIELSRLSDSSILTEIKFLASKFSTNFSIPTGTDEISANEGVQVRIATKAGGPDTARFSLSYMELG